MSNLVKMNDRYLITTRYNNKTADENKIFREKNLDIKYKCVYSNDTVISTISSNSLLFILEMNNDIDKIIGIGLIKTGKYCDPKYNDPKYKLYDNPKLNTFVYTGEQRIDRSEMTESEERVIQILDVLCFTGKRHQKRIKGMSLFPKLMLEYCNKTINLIDTINEMFEWRKNVDK